MVVGIKYFRRSWTVRIILLTMGSMKQHGMAMLGKRWHGSCRLGNSATFEYDVFFDPEILLVGFLHKANLNLRRLKQAQIACTMMTVYLTR